MRLPFFFLARSASRPLSPFARLASSLFRPFTLSLYRSYAPSLFLLFTPSLLAFQPELC